MTLAALALVLTGCSQSASGPVEHYKGEPKGVEAPARSAGGAVYAVWMEKGARFAITLYGSSSCPPVAATYRVSGANKVKVTLEKPPARACTADYAPHTSVFETPSAIRIGTDVAITIVSASGGDPTAIVLPAYPGT